MRIITRTTATDHVTREFAAAVQHALRRLDRLRVEPVTLLVLQDAREPRPQGWQWGMPQERSMSRVHVHRRSLDHGHRRCEHPAGTVEDAQHPSMSVRGIAAGTFAEA